MKGLISGIALIGLFSGIFVVPATAQQTPVVCSQHQWMKISIRFNQTRAAGILRPLQGCPGQLDIENIRKFQALREQMLEIFEKTKLCRRQDSCRAVEAEVQQLQDDINAAGFAPPPQEPFEGLMQQP
jgi:hypothetical protein